MVGTIFTCQTGEAHVIKVLAELLSFNLTTGNFNITKDAIFLRQYDQSRKTLVDVELQAINFPEYELVGNPQFIGLNLSHFHKMLKLIKMMDNLSLFIEADTPNIMNIAVVPKKYNIGTVSRMIIQSVQTLDTDLPTGYGRPIVVNATEFYKGCKDLFGVGGTNVVMTVRGLGVRLTTNADGIMSRDVNIGEKYDSSSTVSEVFEGTFALDRIMRIMKIACLGGKTIQIFPGKGELPLMIRTNVGSLGKISIYIKSKEFMKDECCQDQSGDESD